MTIEDLQILRQKLNKAEALRLQIDELKKIDERSADIKMWGVCLYYDEECENRLYADLPYEDIDKFINVFIKSKIKLLEEQFAAL